MAQCREFLAMLRRLFNKAVFIMRYQLYTRETRFVNLIGSRKLPIDLRADQLDKLCPNKACLKLYIEGTLLPNLSLWYNT